MKTEKSVRVVKQKGIREIADCPFPFRVGECVIERPAQFIKRDHFRFTLRFAIGVHEDGILNGEQPRLAVSSLGEAGK